MALIYFPKDANLGLRDSFNPSYDQLVIATNPNTVLYFDSASGLNAAVASTLAITSSWAATASITQVFQFIDSASFASQSLSSSYAFTASVALNAGSTTNYVTYTTVTTSSAGGITCSFDTPSQVVNITVGQLYTFTQSNMPASGQSADIVLYFNNTAATTSSLSFPAAWKNIGGGFPTSITASKVGVLALRALDVGTVFGTFNIQG